MPLEQATERAQARLAEYNEADLVRSVSHREDDNEFLHTFRSRIKNVLLVQLFEASGKSTPSNVTVSAAKVLSLSGMVIDKVTKVSEVLMALEGPPKSGDISDDEWTAHWTKVFANRSEIVQWQRHLVVKKHTITAKFRKTERLYATGETLETAFVQTICAGSRPGAFSFANQWETVEEIQEAHDSCESHSDIPTIS